MKSLLGKLGVILIGLATFGNAEVWAADWTYLEARVAQEEVIKNYPFLKDFVGGIYCYDRSSIVYPSRNIVKVWVRFYLVDKEPISSSVYSEIKGLPICKGLEVFKMPSLTNLCEISCKERVYKKIRSYGENPKEGIYKEFKQNEEPEYFDYDEIFPDDILSILWEKLCK